MPAYSIHSQKKKKIIRQQTWWKKITTSNSFRKEKELIDEWLVETWRAAINKNWHTKNKRDHGSKNKICFGHSALDLILLEQ